MNAEEVEPSKFKKVYTGVRAYFFIGCLTYIVNKFPWDDALLLHAFVDFEKRKTCSFHSVHCSDPEQISLDMVMFFLFTANL